MDLHTYNTLIKVVYSHLNVALGANNDSKNVKRFSSNREFFNYIQGRKNENSFYGAFNYLTDRMYFVAGVPVIRYPRSFRLKSPKRVKEVDIAYITQAGKAVQTAIESIAKDHMLNTASDFIEDFMDGYESMPFQDILDFIFCYNRVTGKLCLQQGSYVPLFIKGYLQLTLYFSKQEVQFSNDLANAFKRQFISSDADLPFFNGDNAPDVWRVRAIIADIMGAVDAYMQAAPDFIYLQKTKNFVNGEIVYQPSPDKLLPVAFSNGSINYGGGDNKYFTKLTSPIPANQSIANFLTKVFPSKEVAGNKIIASKLVLVPKDYSKPRVIAMEEPNNGLCQQLYMRAINHVLSGIPSLDITNQDNNAYLAYCGSVSRSYATIDLRAASDSITLEHIRDLFPENWVNILLGLRSTAIDVDGEKFLLRKYATMGNALTFPIETILFYAIVRSVVPDTEYVSVFGDDIVVPNCYFQPVLDRLIAYGFTPNSEKSFAYSTYRESCGKHFFDGIDVTIVYRRHEGITYEHVEELKKVWGFPNLNFMALPNAEGFINDFPNRIEEKKRFRSNADTQYYEVLHTVSRSKNTGDIVPDENRLDYWYLLYANNNAEITEPRQVPNRLRKEHIERKWIPIKDVPYIGYLTDVEIKRYLMSLDINFNLKGDLMKRSSSVFDAAALAADKAIKDVVKLKNDHTQLERLNQSLKDKVKNLESALKKIEAQSKSKKELKPKVDKNVRKPIKDNKVIHPNKVIKKSKSNDKPKNKKS